MNTIDRLFFSIFQLFWICLNCVYHIYWILLDFGQFVKALALRICRICSVNLGTIIFYKDSNSILPFEIQILLQWDYHVVLLWADYDSQYLVTMWLSIAQHQWELFGILKYLRTYFTSRRINISMIWIKERNLEYDCWHWVDPRMAHPAPQHYWWGPRRGTEKSDHMKLYNWFDLEMFGR